MHMEKSKRWISRGERLREREGEPKRQTNGDSVRLARNDADLDILGWVSSGDPEADGRRMRWRQRNWG